MAQFENMCYFHMPDYETTIVRTKLHRPTIPEGFVQRLGLYTLLSNFRSRPLTLVSAAAGYGKSTLVSGWLEEQDCCSAWLSLDESHNGIRDFICYFAASIHSVFPEALQDTKDLACQAQLPPMKSISACLINELDLLEEPLIIALDDIHSIHETLVKDLLVELLNYLPQNIHLILIGRRDLDLPIARMRASGSITEIRAGDLEFSPEETRLFLNNTIRQKVDLETAKAWTDRIEGWVTGLRLATLTLDTPDQELTKDPYLSWKSRELTMEYMLKEVLGRMDPGIITQLLLSSITDRFCASLCDALQTTDEDKASENLTNGNTFIALLKDMGLFLIPLDDENKWFRYHHLFRDLLRNEMVKQLNPQLLNSTHGNASKWFNIEGFYEEAIKHALRSNDSEWIVRLFEQVSRTITENGNWFALRELLSKLPESVLTDNKEFLFSKALIAAYQWDLNNLHESMTQLQAVIDSHPEPNDYAAEIAFCRGLYSLHTTGMDKQLVNLQAAMDGISEADPHLRQITEAVFAIAGHIDGRKDHVIGTFDRIIIETTSIAPARLSWLYIALAHMHLMSCSLTAVKSSISKGQRILKPHQNEHLSIVYNWMIGQIHLAKGEYDEAIAFHKLAVDCRYTHSHPWRTTIDNLTSLAIAFQLKGQSDKAESTLENLREYTTHLAPASALFVNSCEARLLLLRGETRQACAWLEMTGPVDYEVFLYHFFDLPAVTYCRVLIAKGSASSLDVAEAKLLEIIDFAELTNNSFQLIMTLPVLAQVYNLKEDIQATDRVLEKSLKLAEPEGVLFPFLELGHALAIPFKRQLTQGKVSKQFVKNIGQHLRMIKDAATNQSTELTANEALPAPLTKREIEVLIQLRQGLYQKEIAVKLFVSPETVKTHLKHIYQKLDVRGRREAIERGNALDLRAD